MKLQQQIGRLLHKIKIIRLVIIHLSLVVLALSVQIADWTVDTILKKKKYFG